MRKEILSQYYPKSSHKSELKMSFSPLSLSSFGIIPTSITSIVRNKRKGH